MLPFSTYDQAIALANNTTYGLGASVWSPNIALANEIAQQLEAGSVWVNTHFDLDPRVPFGGHKMSGLGVEMGVEGLKSFCNIQTLYLRKVKL
jgi:acyl-CoA reductase-like NAD-dependent aldehyde dehydrogenase